MKSIFQPKQQWRIEKTMTNDKRGIVLEGFLLGTHSPDAESLSIELDCTKLSGQDYLSLIRNLEDVLTQLDEEYAEHREARGRGIRGKYRRLASNGERPKRTRKLRFLPIPSPLASAVKNLRRTFYAQIIHKNCLVVKKDTVGQTTRALYLLPYAKAPRFMLELAELNKKLDDVNEKIRESFTEGSRKIARILKGYHVTYPYDPDHNVAARFPGSEVDLHPFNVDLTPVSIDPNVVKELADTKTREVFRNLDEQEKRGLELLQRELEEQRRNLVISGIQQLQNEITEIVSRLLGEARLDPDRARQTLERLKTLAESSGLEAISKSVISPLIDVCDDPLKAEAVFGKDVNKGIDGRMKALIHSL